MKALTNTAASLVDRLLDDSIVGGYSAIGAAVRRPFWPADAEPFDGTPDIVVTGAGSGLGAAAASGLAALGARLHLVGRTKKTLESTASQIRSKVPGALVVVHVCDMGDLDSVRAFSADLHRDLDSLHALIHCAGVMPPSRTETAQGLEMAFAVHAAGPYLLTTLTRDLLSGVDGRVVFVSSGGMYAVPLTSGDFQYTTGDYKGMTAYARTKRMQVVLAEQLAAQFDRPGDPVVHSMHPGWAATPGVTDSMPGFGKLMSPILRTAEQGADTIVWLAAASAASERTGLFWNDRRPRRTHYPSWRKDDPAIRIALWNTLQKLAKSA